MSIDWKVLGRPGEDNAVSLKIDTGQSIHTILIDCGEGVLDTLRIGEIQSIEHLCFSHLHMDHVCGFDGFFRHNYNRSDSPVSVWGPGGTRDILHHRFRSFVWNLHHEQPGEWLVRDLEGAEKITPDSMKTSRFLTRDAFENREDHPERTITDGVALKTPAYEMKVVSLPHHTTRSIGYLFREATKVNVDPEALRRSGLTPGPWLQELIDEARPGEEAILVEGQELNLARLRESILTETSGKSLAYLTDFRLEPDTAEWEALVDWLNATDVLICESQYRASDAVLASKNGHMTTDLVGMLAQESNVGELFLHHLSRRYTEKEWGEMLEEARRKFPRASFPANWTLAS